MFFPSEDLPIESDTHIDGSTAGWLAKYVTDIG